MKYLFCCEFYFPSVGGVQEVMKQVAERLIQRGHEVTVATTKISNRNFTELNGVKIREFNCSGNIANGLNGELKKYQEFILSYVCDAILIKAAEQWTFDALWEIIDNIKVDKYFIPCGFLSFYDPIYIDYYRNLPNILKKFKKLIFYSNNYRDINFIKANGIETNLVISNAASELEFSDVIERNIFRTKYNIRSNSFLIFTVGSLTGAKGHKELCEALLLLEKSDLNITLVLNGNNPYLANADLDNTFSIKEKDSVFTKLKERINFILINWKKVISVAVASKGNFSILIKNYKKTKLLIEVSKLTPANIVENLVNKINSNNGNIKAVLLNLSRSELIEAYFSADLFVLASHVEYSPLVLFEACAAGLPFLSTPVGNVDELRDWFQGGYITPGTKDDKGFISVNPQDLANSIHEIILKKDELKEMGKKMRSNWQKYYGWNNVTSKYEDFLSGKI